MALLQYTAPVNYSEQKQLFKEFLENFKTFESASESSATEAIEDLRIHADDDVDGDDAMEDDDEYGQQTTGRKREPKLKYMQVLQEAADRARNNVIIELDDLNTVSLPPCYILAYVIIF